MATLFVQESFTGGLNTRLEASKLPAAEYPLLFNGRITTNTIRPVMEHLKLDIPGGSNRQGLYAVGKILMLFTDGNAFWKDTEDLSSPWNLISGWSAMSTTAPRIYAEPIPVSYFQGSIDYTSSNDPAAPIVTFPGIPAQTKSYLFVTDGLTQPRVIAADQSWRITGTWGSWTTTNPEYVPLCILPKKSGSKLFLVDPTSKNQIYQSVTGRFLDFVINRAATGDKGGDATTTSKSVDYNQITALGAMVDPASTTGSLFVGTLFASYIITPDYTDTIFAEPALRDRDLFPTGPVNERSFANLNGDSAFISQAGIQSFNATQQFRMESNNFPLGAKIAKILVNPQQNTAACNFDTYALFSVNTVYGKVVLVYDNILETFVSIDLDFGEVVDFAVTRWEGTQKLFFLTATGEVYQAYGGSEYATCRIYLGEYATYDEATGKQVPGRQHLVDKIRLQFTEVKEDLNIQLSLYMDRKLVKTEARTVTAEVYPENIPYPLPFSSHKQSYPVDFAILNKPRGWKTGVLLEWNTAAELISISCEGETIQPTSLNLTGTSSSPLSVITVFNDNAFGAELAGHGGWELVSGLAVGEYYSVVGSAHIGNKIVTDNIFAAPGTEVNVTGSLAKCGNVKTVWDRMLADKPNKIIGLGDHAMSNGSGDDVTRILTVVSDLSKVSWVAGNHDVVTDSGKWFFAAAPSLRYYKVTVGSVDFFLLNSDPSEPDGITSSGNMAMWLKAALASSTNTFKVVGFHHPPYTDVDPYYPGYTDLRWPFKPWGADLVISAHSHVYERFVVDGLPYIVNGASGSGARLFAAGQNNSEYRISSEGYLRLTADKFKLLGEFVNPVGTILDAFSINA